MVLKIPISDELEQTLKKRAAAAGKDAEQFAREAIEEKLRGPRTLDDILAPFRDQVASGGLSDEQLDNLFNDARQKAWDDRQRGLKR